jgi:formylmethanofuran dehydrogenase subunit E
MSIKFGIANPCYKCGNLTKHIEWVKGYQKAICSKCLERDLL